VESEEAKMILSRGSLKNARAFIEAKARPLEKARLHYHFDGGLATDVVEELAKFQNSDGGFGNALEPDLRTPESSALATSIAFQLFREIDLGTSDAMAPSGARYLVDTFDDVRMTWRIIPKTAENSPHAPWWGQAGREENFNIFSLNPTAELLGYLFEYGKDVVPPDQLLTIWRKILSHLGNLDKIEMHDFLCCKRLAETTGLDAGLKAQLIDNLRRLLENTISLQSSQWLKYGLRPIQVADSPKSPFFESLRDAVMENLDFEVKTQQENGSWVPTWSWGDNYPDVWEKAKIEWSGALTVEKLIVLKRYGRIEGMPT